MWDHAARTAGEAAEQIRDLTSAGDPAAAADAAWAAADTLHVAASVLRSRVVRQAAIAYDRAARVPYGRLPRRTPAGTALRRAARLLSAAAYAGHDRTLAQAALITRLAGLAQAVSELRLAQAHHAQAAAARSAAMYLRGGDSSSAESLVAGHVKTEPSNLACDGFPAPPRPTRPSHQSHTARDGRPPGRRPEPMARRPRGPGH